MHSKACFSVLRSFCWSMAGCAIAMQAWATGLQAPASYRALEPLSELRQAPAAVVESLDSFLRDQEKTLEALLASQEAWAMANSEGYKPLPDAQAFVANPQRDDESRKQAFIAALRIAPDSKFALFLDANLPTSASPARTGSTPLAANEVLTAAALANTPLPPQHFIALHVGDSVSPLDVVSTATDEPDYGLDLFLWDDSPHGAPHPAEWGAQPYGNPASASASRWPFVAGYFHENAMLYKVAPWAKRSVVTVRFYQYASLAALALRTGHDYWGWRFAGMALHYVQNLTNPYHARLAPGESLAPWLAYNILAKLGATGPRDKRMRALRHQSVLLDALCQQLLPGSLDALQNPDKDSSYPEWNSDYLPQVVAAQSAALADTTREALLDTLPADWTASPPTERPPSDADLRQLPVWLAQNPMAKAKLQALVNARMANWGAHSRNALRAIVKAGKR